jgi:hypothetical protein
VTWYAWAIVAYYVFDRLATVAWVGHRVDITPALAAANLITGALIVWAVLALAGVA